MHIIVLGAGLAGVTTAWYLLKEGHQVTVIDRQPSPALETSYANGGQISVSHPEPWANPHAPAQIIRWIGRKDAPILFKPRANPKQWRWGLSFLYECLPSRTQRNTEAIASLAQISVQELRKLREETGIQYHSNTRGILHLFFSRKDFSAAAFKLETLHRLGLNVELSPSARCLELEPALEGSRASIAGGIYAPEDESGDAHLFVQGLARLCSLKGAKFRFGLNIERLLMRDDQVTGVKVCSNEGMSDILAADAYVLATGHTSARLVAPLGVKLNIYPIKGYSVTIPAGSGAPTLSITDESRRIVLSRLGDSLRIAGTAELGGEDLNIDPARAQSILNRALDLFPNAGIPELAQFWAGLRPAVPSNVPYVGRSPLHNLYLNTGHGTLGWTLACGSARVLSDLIEKRPQTWAFTILTG